jgi:predicted XRE-type DNA-binding protein
VTRKRESETTDDATMRDWQEVRSAVVQDNEGTVKRSERVLARIRRQRDLTQKAVAEQMGVTQARVSAIEKGEMTSTEVATLAKYVSALGGKLRLVADFGDDALVLE